MRVNAPKNYTSISSNLEETYIPKFNGNRDLPASEQVIVTLKRLTNGKKKKLRTFQYDRNTEGITTMTQTEQLMTDHVPSIDNFFVGEVKIDNGEKLFNTRGNDAYSLLVELEGELFKDELEEEEVEDLKKDSASPILDGSKKTGEKNSQKE
ncbi:hypothetical protein [Spirochaeta cellobiosiphila]|uniref:hypothetical protein n=1 Tax=Spirochaeta cellobiosiphila TaxID=504483 RepID=UPI0003FAC082|nr:hypothetical protein [Spirochaeta cellobiosiphila]